MKKYFTFLIGIFFFHLANAQNEQYKINSFLQSGNYTEAKVFIDSLLEIRKHKKDPYYHYLGGRVYKGLFESSGRGNWDEKMPLLKNTFDHFLNAYQISNQKASNKVYQNNANQTLERCIAVIDELVLEELNEKALDLSKYLYQKCIDSKAFSKSLTAELGIRYASILEKNEDYELAIEIYEELISKESILPEIFMNLSYLYQSQNDYEKVVEVLLQGRKIYPKSNALNVELVNYTLQSEESMKIIGELESALASDSSNFQLASSIATLYDKLEFYERAKVYYKKAIALKPESMELHYNLAVLLYNQFIELNKFLLTGDSDLSFQDINAQRDRLIKQCKEKFTFLREKGFRTEEVNAILSRLNNL